MWFLSLTIPTFDDLIIAQFSYVPFTILIDELVGRVFLQKISMPSLHQDQYRDL